MLATILLLRRLLREKTSKNEVSTVYNNEDVSSRDDGFATSCLASGATTKIKLGKLDKSLTLINVVFSASDSGKYRILKNGIAIATLFTTSQIRNVPYNGEIKLKKEDELSFEFTNMGRMAMDMYVGFDARRNRK